MSVIEHDQVNLFTRICSVLDCMALNYDLHIDELTMWEGMFVSIFGYFQLFQSLMALIVWYI